MKRNRGSGDGRHGKQDWSKRHPLMNIVDQRHCSRCKGILSESQGFKSLADSRQSLVDLTQKVFIYFYRKKSCRHNVKIVLFWSCRFGTLLIYED